MRKDSNLRSPDGAGVLQTPVVAAGPRIHNFGGVGAIRTVNCLSTITP